MHDACVYACACVRTYMHLCLLRAKVWCMYTPNTFCVIPHANRYTHTHTHTCIVAYMLYTRLTAFKSAGRILEP